MIDTRVYDKNSSPGGKARSHEAGAGTVSRPMTGLNAGSIPAPRVTSVEVRAAFIGYVIEFQPRQRWAWSVYHNRQGKPIARCNSQSDAEKVAKALNVATAASAAAAEGVRI